MDEVCHLVPTLIVPVHVSVTTTLLQSLDNIRADALFSVF